MTAPYTPRRAAQTRFVPVRGISYHLLEWQPDAADADPALPPIVMAHGWMDVAASFQFVVDAMDGRRRIVAPDWRGFGLTENPGVDSYWFPDYLGDLDALLDHVAPGGAPVDLVGHSMGGNVAMVYAGIRPERVRRLVNLEGFGMPETRSAQAPGRYRAWLDELRTPPRLTPYQSLDGVAARLQRNNPRLAPDKAAWLASHWSSRREDGLWHVRADAAHKRANPVLYRKDEIVACWRRIEAPTLWVEGADTDVAKFWGDRYPRADFEERIAVVPRLTRHVLPDCGHMLHHDQPGLLARHLGAFLDAP